MSNRPIGKGLNLHFNMHVQENEQTNGNLFAGIYTKEVLKHENVQCTHYSQPIDVECSDCPKPNQESIVHSSANSMRKTPDKQ